MTLEPEEPVEGAVEAAVVVYLLGDILNDFNSTNVADQEQIISVSKMIE